MIHSVLLVATFLARIVVVVAVVAIAVYVRRIALAVGNNRGDTRATPMHSPISSDPVA